MAEVTSKVIVDMGPNLQGQSKKLVYVEGTCAASNDTLTVPNLTSVKGHSILTSTGLLATTTIATNVITLTNGGTFSWAGLVWGTP